MEDSNDDRESSKLPTLAERVNERLTRAEETLAVAESCTAGLLASTVTDVPGSSAYFDRAVVSYSNDAKQELLGVSRESLDSDGAVSESVAVEMARGIRDTAGATWSVSTTGIAGPGGGTDEKPVGTVWIGVAYAGPWGTNTSMARATRYEFDGTRLERKRQFTEQALMDLLDAVEEHSVE